MAVDPNKPRTILVIHGVQTSSNMDLNQHQLIAKLIQSRLSNMPLNFTTELFSYENLNDQVQRDYNKLVKFIMDLPVGLALTAKTLDVVLDVVTELKDTSTAAKIRQGFKDKIMSIYDSESPCYIVAHSLGSIYAFDVVNELIAETKLFDRASRRTWPVQGLVTLGSPIGLAMFNNSRPKLSPLGPGNKLLRWLNYWDVNDPVVSGKVFGQTLTRDKIAENYQTADPNLGWVIRDSKVDTGKFWLMAHTEYWNNPMVGDGLFDLITH